MKWAYRKYRLWVVNTEIEANLHLWDKWKYFIPSLDILINLTSEQAHIRSFQSYEQQNKWLGFGRMEWNEKNNIKWTTKYRDDNLENKKTNFFCTEIWAPDWNKSCKEGTPPQIFIKLYNYPSVEKIREGLVIAMPNSLYKKNKTLVDSQISKIADIIPNSTVTTLTRYWQPSWKFLNRIEDMNPHELQKIVTAGKRIGQEI